MASRPRKYWLMKSEPDVYSIDHLAKDGKAEWDGIRNYQARNFMRDEMKMGDLVIFYHSNAKPPGAAGIARVASAPYPDPTQFQKKSKYFDAKSSKDDPRWILVDVEFVERFDDLVGLGDLKGDPSLEGMLLIQKGQRLSIQPVDKKHFKRVLSVAGAKTRVS
ncbi:MAG: EVE domain-containing protein [Deltaproteobacteria bacterium]|nr:EVE domain-containing protein [Deltaproteobacteria bacterium]